MVFEGNKNEYISMLHDQFCGGRMSMWVVYNFNVSGRDNVVRTFGNVL